MWTTDEFRYHPSWWRDWEFENRTGVDRPSRIYDQNFGPGTTQTTTRRRVSNHHMPHFHVPRHFNRAFPRDPLWDYDIPGPMPPPLSPKDEAALKETKEGMEKLNVSGTEASGGRPADDKLPRPEDLPPKDRGMSEVINDKDKYQVSLDVAQFSPEEISVKTVDQYLVVECKHEERADEHGFITRSFTRKYILPKNVDPVSVESSLTPEGTLIVSAPKRKDGDPHERKIRIDMAPPMPPLK